MSRAPGQQSSIRSFFQPRQLPKFAAPPTSTPLTTTTTKESTPNPPPPAPPLPPPTANSAPSPPPTLPLLPSPPSLPSQASILPVSSTHVPALRRINSLLLSVPYPDSFYAALLDPLASGLFSRVILWHDDPPSSSEPKVIGGIVCRLEPDASAGGHAIYLQSLALLSPYRAQGLAAAALEHIVASAALLPDDGPWAVRSVYAHVWTENEDGLRWYAARGFQREGSEPVRGYYYKLRPDTAWIVRRRVGPGAEGPPAPSATQGVGRAVGGVVAAAVNLPPMSNGVPPPRRPAATPSPSGSTLSFQNARPETEWNDLPEEMVKGGGAGAGRNQLVPPPSTSGPGSATSSRSSSAVRKKKERTYPTAAFGN